MLGLYDSGLGGLTVLRALRAAGIDQDVVYFADQAHAPYGDRSDAELHGFLRENLAVLADAGADAVVTACNTSCAVAGRLGWPATPFPVLDLIANAAGAIAAAPHRRIAVVATAATVRAHAYAAAIGARAPAIDVVEIAAPALVPIVEAGDAATPRARDAVAAALAGLPRDVEAVVYGCTHYPMLDQHFAAVLDPRIARIDPADAQAAAARDLVARSGWAPGTGAASYATNGDPVAFAAAVRRWTGDAAPRFVTLAPA